MDRRPLSSRSWRWTNRLAAVLVRSGITPNAISVFGMICGVLAGVTLWGTSWLAWACPSCQEVLGLGPLCRAAFLLAAALIQIRLLCNLIDGMVAIEGHRQSVVGDLYNEIPDRVSDACTIVGAGYAIFGWSVLGWCAALLAVMTAYVRSVGKGQGLANDYCGPMAKPHRMALLTGLCVVMAIIPESWLFRFTPSWLEPLGVDTFHPLGIPGLALVIIALGSAITCVRRVHRIAKQLHARDRHGV